MRVVSSQSNIPSGGPPGHPRGCAERPHFGQRGSLPPFLGSWIEEGRDDVAVPVLTMLTALSTQVRWGLRIGMWVFGTDSFADLIGTARDYTLDGITHQITAANLIMDPTTTRTSRASRDRSRRPSPAPPPRWAR